MVFQPYLEKGTTCFTDCFSFNPSIQALIKERKQACHGLGRSTRDGTRFGDGGKAAGYSATPIDVS